MFKNQVNILKLNILKYNYYNKKLWIFSINLFNTLLGFFFASSLATIPGQTGDWGIIGAAIIVSLYEIISFINYGDVFYLSYPLVRPINNIKIGILYGLLVDAFKLGS
jgi:Protein of unknown function (DUF565)